MTTRNAVKQLQISNIICYKKLLFFSLDFLLFIGLLNY